MMSRKPIWVAWCAGGASVDARGSRRVIHVKGAVERKLQEQPLRLFAAVYHLRKQRHSPPDPLEMQVRVLL